LGSSVWGEVLETEGMNYWLSFSRDTILSGPNANRAQPNGFYPELAEPTTVIFAPWGAECVSWQTIEQ